MRIPMGFSAKFSGFEKFKIGIGGNGIESPIAQQDLKIRRAKCRKTPESTLPSFEGMSRN
jgi:hypothetical protein